MVIFFVSFGSTICFSPGVNSCALSIGPTSASLGVALAGAASCAGLSCLAAVEDEEGSEDFEDVVPESGFLACSGLNPGGGNGAPEGVDVEGSVVAYVRCCRGSRIARALTLSAGNDRRLNRGTVDSPAGALWLIQKSQRAGSPNGAECGMASNSLPQISRFAGARLTILIVRMVFENVSGPGPE